MTPEYERRAAERRVAATKAIARHFALCDRRMAERRAATSAAQGDWTGRYDRARKC